MALKNMIHGSFVKDALDEVLTKARVALKNLVSVTTNGAMAMVEKRVGLIAPMRNAPRFP